jgi:hypothetical protein
MLNLCITCYVYLKRLSRKKFIQRRQTHRSPPLGPDVLKWQQHNNVINRCGDPLAQSAQSRLW